MEYLVAFQAVPSAPVPAPAAASSPAQYQFSVNSLICITLGVLFPLSAIAESGWNEDVQRLRDQFTQSKAPPNPNVYPELAGRVDGLFRRYSMTHIVIHGFSDDRTPNTTDLYISEKEICVSQSDEGWNLYADGDHVFEWEQGGSSSFSANDFVNASEMAGKLKTHSDALSQYIWKHFGDFNSSAQQILTDPNSTKQQQLSALVAGLNEILLDGSLYGGQRFANIKLSPETLALKLRFPQGESSMQLNRLLLEDAYPLEFKGNQQVDKEGIRTKRNNEELIEYLWYLTDPSWIMASLYREYLDSPATFNRQAHENGKRVDFYVKHPEMFKDFPVTAFSASEKPLWFYGFQLKDQKTGRSDNVLTISEPEEVKEIPARIKDQLKTIHFQDSNLSLARHMSFL